MAAPSLDSVRFDTSGFQLQGDPFPNQRVWHTQDGDGCGLFHFDCAPDLPQVDSVQDLGFHYLDNVMGPGQELVDLTVFPAPVCGGVLSILSVVQPSEPGQGITAVGAITIPFEQLSYVLKVQCGEHGMTGQREALLLDRALAEGAVTMDEEGNLDQGNWSPYDAEYDAQFPAHPVSRARRVLSHMRTTLALQPELSGLPGFPLPLQ